MTANVAVIPARESSVLPFSGVIATGVRIQEPLQSVAGQSPGGQPGTNIPSGSGIKKNTANGSATAGQLAGEQTKPGQAQSWPPQHTAEQKRQGERGALSSLPSSLVMYGSHVVAVILPVIAVITRSQKCDNTARRAKDATHLKMRRMSD